VSGAALAAGSAAAPTSGEPAAGALCENCAAPLTGRYCAQCGQKHGHSVQSVQHFLRDATEDLTHTDSRLWRTLWALLARPGTLTREYLDGHRVRYLPPLRLYLVVSLAFFLLAALRPAGPGIVEVHATPSPSGQTAKHLATPAAPAERSLQWHVGTALSAADADELCHDILDGTQRVWSVFGNVQPRLLNSCTKLLSSGGNALWEPFLRNMERAMFVFLPVLALFACLLYWRPRRYYVEHLLFFLHNHAFVFVMWTLEIVVALLIPVKAVSMAVNWAASAYIPWYLFRSMRRVYGQGKLLTLAKFLVLVCIYAVTAVATLSMTGLYSALSL
jgi:hypothetical protein